MRAAHGETEVKITAAGAGKLNSAENEEADVRMSAKRPTHSRTIALRDGSFAKWHSVTAAPPDTAPVIRTRSEADRAIMELASRQHGVVSRVQLIHTGVTADRVDRRLNTGLLQRVHRGVYLVGPLSAPHTREMAAVLACGETASLSGLSAAVFWQMTSGGNGDGPVQVIVTSGRTGRHAGIRVRHVRTLRTEEVTVRDGIPVTTPARTLFDLAAEVGERELERALAEAFALRLADRSQVLKVLDRHTRRPGATRLRRLLERDPRLARTRSEAEERFLALIRRARIRDPEVNTRVAGYKVDFLWRAERLVVEVDGQAFHASSRRFESDRRRDAVLLAAGLRVMRVTWQQIVNEPEAMLIRLAHALGPPPQG